MKKIISLTITLLLFCGCLLFIGCGDTTTTNTNNTTNHKTTHKSIRLSLYDKKVFSDDDGDKYILTFYPDDSELSDHTTAGSIEIERIEKKTHPNNVDIYYKIYCHKCGEECDDKTFYGKTSFWVGNDGPLYGTCYREQILDMFNNARLKIEHYNR